MRCIAILSAVAALTVATPTLEEQAETVLRTRAINKVGSSKATFLSEELKQAYINQDGAALAKYSSNAQQDYERLTRTMDSTELSPFNQATLNGKKVHFYGDERAYIWSTVIKAEGPEPEEMDFDMVSESNSSLELDSINDVEHKATVEIGFYSASGGQASSFELQIPRIVADGALSLGLVIMVQRLMRNFLAGRAPAAALWAAKRYELLDIMDRNKPGSGITIKELSKAMEAASKAESAMYREAAGRFGLARHLAIHSEFFGGVIAVLVTIGVTWLSDTYLVPLIFRDYKVKVTILNLDERPWTINNWHSDNAMIDGGGNFTIVTLGTPPGRNVPFLPDLQANLTEATDVTYTFQNGKSYPATCCSIGDLTCVSKPLVQRPWRRVAS